MTAKFHAEPEFDRRGDALDAAKAHELKTDGEERRFVVYINDARWLVTDSQPPYGFWYTADGARHGER